MGSCVPCLILGGTLARDMMPDLVMLLITLTIKCLHAASSHVRIRRLGDTAGATLLCKTDPLWPGLVGGWRIRL